MVTKEDIIERLGKFDVRKLHLNLHIPSTFSRASVLIPLFYKSDEWHVLLTVRSHSLKTHSGLVAFPGGRFDEDDIDEIFTALRESEEEIGLPPDSVEVISVLPKSVVRPNILVDLVVGIIPSDFIPKPNPDEVRLVFSLPLIRFLRDDIRCVKSEFNGQTVGIYYIDDVINGEKIVTWGFTGMFCMLVAIVALKSDKTVEDYSGNIHTKDNAFNPEMSSGQRFILSGVSKI